ncbi:MAG: oligosaccharide flippase family protein [Clostridia bacterium]|nr:oligosaccharide flippase family protein [Clostridia bacterium]
MRGDIIAKNVFQTALTVTIFSCAERFLGFLYRIFLSRTLGAEGLGIYQISLSVLGLFMTVTSSGIPITVSRMMIKYKSKNQNQKVDSTITAGILLAITISVPLILLIFSKSGFLNFLFSDQRCLPVLAIMIPGLIFTSVYAVLRGSFWGNNRFLAYSVIEFLEESVMLVAGIILVNLTTDITKGVHMAGYAVLISYLFSFTVALIYFFIKGGKLKSPKRQFLPLIKSSAPITATKTSTSLINTLIAVILPARLVSFGLSSSDAVTEFGKVFGMAFPLIFMPSTLIGSLALVLVPELSSNFYSKNYNKLKSNVEKAIKFSCFISCLIIPVFLSVGNEISEFLYSDGSVGNYVVLGAITMLPLSVSIITTSMLNSLNKEKQTLLSFFIGASAMILCIYFLPKFLGVNALTVGMIINYLLTAIFNLTVLAKTCPKKPTYKRHLAFSAFTVIPSALFGYFLKGIFARFCPVWITAVVCSLLIALFSLTLSYVFGLIDFFFETRPELKVFKKRKPFKNGNKRKQNSVVDYAYEKLT